MGPTQSRHYAAEQLFEPDAVLASSTAEEVDASLAAIAADRAKFWPQLLGAAAARRRHAPGYFAALISIPAAALCQDVVMQIKRIEADFDRFGHPPQMLLAVRAILAAYAIRNPGVGYVASLGFLAPALLSAVRDPEIAFWCLAALVESVHLFGCHPFGTAGFGELEVFTEVVRQHAPRALAHLEADGRGDYFAGPTHGLMLLGAARWVGALFAPTSHPQGSDAGDPGASGRYRLCHECVDACCLLGLDAAHLMGLELLRRAEPRLLLARELEEMLSSVRDLEAELTGALSAAAVAIGEGGATPRTQQPAAHPPHRPRPAPLLSAPLRCPAMVRSVCEHRRRIRSIAARATGSATPDEWAAQAVDGPGQPHRPHCPASDGPIDAIAPQYRRWSRQLHALCCAPHRAAVRAVLVLHARGDGVGLALLPTDVLVRHVLPAIPIDTDAWGHVTNPAA